MPPSCQRCAREPTSPRRGEGVLGAAADEVATSPASSSHPSTNFTRSAIPEPIPSGITPNSSTGVFRRLTQKVG